MLHSPVERLACWAYGLECRASAPLPGQEEQGARKQHLHLSTGQSSWPSLPSWHLSLFHLTPRNHAWKAGQGLPGLRSRRLPGRHSPPAGLRNMPSPLGTVSGPVTSASPYILGAGCTILTAPTAPSCPGSSGSHLYLLGLLSTSSSSEVTSGRSLPSFSIQTLPFLTVSFHDSFSKKLPWSSHLEGGRKHTHRQDPILQL